MAKKQNKKDFDRYYVGTGDTLPERAEILDLAGKVAVATPWGAIYRNVGQSLIFSKKKDAVKAAEANIKAKAKAALDALEAWSKSED